MIHEDPVLAAMDAIVDATPDTGEGGTYHLRSGFARELRSDYRRAMDGDESVIDEYVDEITTLEQVRAACVRSAAKAIARWVEETMTREGPAHRS